MKMPPYVAIIAMLMADWEGNQVRSLILDEWGRYKRCSEEMLA